MQIDGCGIGVYYSYIIYNSVRVCVYNAGKIALVAVALSYRSNIGAFACVALLACRALSVRVYYIIVVAITILYRTVKL